MAAWMVVPLAMPAFTIPALWIVYAMALSNNHICPLHNWVYNQSCEAESPISCCTIDQVPLLSRCGNLPPESCFFSLICSMTSLLAMLVVLLRYALVLEHCGPSKLNTMGLIAGWTCAAGLMMTGSFQVNHVRLLHYIGTSMMFFALMVFLFLQSILTYRMAASRGHYWTGHLRSVLLALAFVTLIVLLGLMAYSAHHLWYSERVESFVLQHMAALSEWVFSVSVLVFYGTFALEFGAVSTETLLVLMKNKQTPKSYRVDSHPRSMSHLENLAMSSGGDSSVP